MKCQAKSEQRVWKKKHRGAG